MKIQTTRNYNLFSFDTANRSIGKLKPMIESMKKYGWRSAYPMDVYPNESGPGYIIRDGQHRFEAAKALKLPVKYVIEKNDADAAEINKPQHSWNIADYVTSKRNKGIPDYQKLLDFHQQHHLPLGISAMLLMNRTSTGSTISEAIKSGGFHVRSADKANLVASILAEINQKVPWNAVTRNLAGALAQLTHVKQFDAAVLLNKIQKFPHILRHQPTISLFLENLEDLYNHASRQRVPLKFLAEEATKGRNITLRK